MRMSASSRAPQGKELRPIAEKVITHGKERRWQLAVVERWIPSSEATRTISRRCSRDPPRFISVPGVTCGSSSWDPVWGDGAEMEVLEFVDRS